MRDGERLLSRDSLSRFNRSLALSFGLLIVLVMAVMAVVGGLYYRSVLTDESNRLQGIITELVHEAVTRVSFSGKYQARLLVEELVLNRPSVIYVVVADRHGQVLAHSDPRFNGTVDRSSEMEQALTVLSGEPQVVQELRVGGQSVREVALPYLVGYDRHFGGVVRVGVSDEPGRRALVEGLWYLALIGLVLLVAVSLAVLKLSDHFAQPLRRLAGFFGGILDHAPLLISLRERDGRLLETSRAFDQVFPEARPGSVYYDALPGDAAERIRADDERVFTRNEGLRAEEMFVVDGEARHYAVTRFPLSHDGEGRPELLCAIALDVTGHKRAEERLYQEKEMAQVTLRSIADAVISTDRAGRIRYMNPVAEQITGWTLAEAGDRPLEEIYRITDANSGEPLSGPVEQVLERQGVMRGRSNALLRTRGGRLLPVDDSAAPLRDRNDQVIGMVLVFRDVSLARELASRMEFQATHDPLTGLFNRTVFEARLDRLTRDPERSHVLCYMDLDQFKVVNDTCGHAAGDELLRQLAAVLQYHVVQPDIIARLGGDEFGVLFLNRTAEEGVRAAEELMLLVEEFRFFWEGNYFTLGASVGVVPLQPGGLDTPNDALIAADTACYMAKEQGRNRLQIHRPGDDELHRRHGEMQWVGRLRRAMDDGRLRLFRQRIVPLSDSGAGEHWEILLRMVDEDGRLVSPAQFIGAAERYDLMARLDRWVVSEALRAQSRFPQAHFSVNLSGPSLADDGFFDFVRAAVTRFNVDLSRINFEITETAAIRNLNRATRFITAMKSLGCTFALDDFGSGMASFGYLRSLPVDILKIDGSFIRNVLDDPINQALVESACRIGQALNIRIVGECVESADLVDYLREVGVDYGQGYFFHRPEPLPD